MYSIIENGENNFIKVLNTNKHTHKRIHKTKKKISVLHLNVCGYCQHKDTNNIKQKTYKQTNTIRKQTNNNHLYFTLIQKIHYNYESNKYTNWKKEKNLQKIKKNEKILKKGVK